MEDHSSIFRMSLFSNKLALPLDLLVSSIVHQIQDYDFLKQSSLSKVNGALGFVYCVLWGKKSLTLITECQ